MKGYALSTTIFILILLTPVAFAQTSTAELKLDTGEEIFKAACIACHGPNGKGQPQSTLGFEPPSTFPDFTDCNGSTREKEFDWKVTIHEGGHGRGFSEIMPSFAEALTPEQIEKVVKYLRSQCPDTAWPLGEMNLPRALMTEKAFPEDETVLTFSANVTGTPGVSPAYLYEKRIGVKGQLELAVPFSFQRQSPGSWFGGVGDMVVGYKRVIAHSARTGSIFSLQGEVNIPTGNKSRELGNGVTVFETFGSFGQVLPGASFVQLQTGAELPTNTENVPKAAFLRTALGKRLVQNQGFGRSWTPMVELITDRDFETGAKTNLDVVPQFQVSLSRRQHIMVNLGVRFPANNTLGRTRELMFYVLWDWFDGGLTEGWK